MCEQMKILVAYDGSDCANAALEDLQRAGLPRVAQALIMLKSPVRRWRPWVLGSSRGESRRAHER